MEKAEVIRVRSLLGTSLGKDKVIEIVCDNLRTYYAGDNVATTVLKWDDTNGCFYSFRANQSQNSQESRPVLMSVVSYEMIQSISVTLNYEETLEKLTQVGITGTEQENALKRLPFWNNRSLKNEAYYDDSSRGLDK